MDPTPAPALPLSALAPVPKKLPALRRQRDYRNWWGADTSALLAGSVYQFAIPLILLSTTGSPALAGTLASLGLAGRTVLTLFGGSLADRTNRSAMIVFGGVLGALLTGVLALLAWTGSLGVAVLCVGHILLELRGGLFGTATNAALKDVVHPGQLGRAMAANQGRDAALSLGGGPLGGVLLGLGAAGALGFVALFQLVSAFFGRLIAPAVKVAELDSGTSPDQTPSPHGVLSGLRWCFTRPTLRIMLWLIVAVNLGTNGAVTTLVYGLRDRGESPVDIGLVTACMGIGLLLGSAFATWLIDKVPTGMLACLSLSALAGFLMLLGLHSSLWWIGAMLAAAFIGVPALNAAVGGYFMAIAPRDMVGRANAVMLFMALLALPLGPLLAGAGVQLLGMAPTLAFFASITLIATLGAWSSGHIRSIPGPDRWQDSVHQAVQPAAAARNPMHSASARAQRAQLQAELRELHRRQQAGCGQQWQWIYL